jgi:hypothetical protein
MPDRCKYHSGQVRRKLLLTIFCMTGCYICESVAQQDEHNPKAFECGFVYSKVKEGKSGEATCSYTAEKVVSNPSEHFPPNEHCKTEPVFEYKDLTNFQIDLATNRVTWDEEDGLASFEVPGMIEYYMRKQKISKEEAIAKARSKIRLRSECNIYSINKISDRTDTDEISRAPLDRPKYTPAYVITFGDSYTNYSIYISSKTNSAILSEYASNNESSWVNLRFGKCRERR